MNDRFNILYVVSVYGGSTLHVNKIVAAGLDHCLTATRHTQKERDKQTDTQTDRQQNVLNSMPFEFGLIPI